jgi:RNA ligase (TIGR02306 family)
MLSELDIARREQTAELVRKYSERALATIRKIDEIEPIEGKDKIVLAHLDGWQAIVQKDQYAVGDLVVYCEIDSFLPVREEYEFLRSRCFRSTKNLGDGFRIKSMKMGGVLSQGLVFHIPEDTIKGIGSQLEVGLDLTEHLGIQKYEQPIPANLAGKVRGNFPSFIPKTDQERIQNCFRSLENNWMDYTWERTMKLDGSSMTMYCRTIEDTESFDGPFYQYQEGVCSRNLDLLIEGNEGNAFVEMWKTMHEKIKDYCVTFNRQLAFQGELMGEGIQKNRERLTGHAFFCYDIFDIEKQKYLSAPERQRICESLDILHCPDLGNVKFDSDITVKKLLADSDIASLVHEFAEGIVYKAIENPQVSFKVINNRFALQEE